MKLDLEFLDIEPLKIGTDPTREPYIFTVKVNQKDLPTKVTDIKGESPDLIEFQCIETWAYEKVKRDQKLSCDVHNEAHVANRFEHKRVLLELKAAQMEIRAWQEAFDEEMNVAEHQKGRYNTSANDAKIMFVQRRRISRYW